ncbi:hypothetical protein ACFX2A_038950 [Malus domestica]
MATSTTVFKSKRQSDGPNIFRNDEEKMRYSKSHKYKNRGKFLQAVTLSTYFLNTIGAPIKERATGQFIQQSKRHHSSNFEKQILLSKIYQQYSHSTSAPRIPRITLPKNSDKVEAREFQSFSYPTITHKGKGIAPLLANWQIPRCVNLHLSWQSMLTRMPKFSSYPRIQLQQVCLFKNRRGNALGILRVRSPIDLLIQKLKGQRSSHFKSQIFNISSCSKIEETPLFEFQEPDVIG